MKEPFNKQLSILQVLPRLEMGGVERGTVDLVRALVNGRHHAFVASTGGTLVTDVVEAGGIHFDLPLYTKNPLKILINTYHLYKLIKKHNIDLIHCRSRAPAWSCWWATKMAHIAFITTIHGAYKTRPWIKKWYSRVMTKSHRVIAISDYIYNYILQLAPECKEKTVVIHRGIDIHYFDPAAVEESRLKMLKEKWGIIADKPIILFPARLTRLKNHTFLLKALRELSRHDFYCFIVGKGTSAYLKEVEDQIVSYKLEQKVRCVGACYDMPAAYLLADVVVQVAEHPEAFGRVVAEAQAMGVPVIAPACGGPQEILIDQVTGWLYNPSRLQEFLNSLQQALELSFLDKKKLASIARERVLKYFDSRTMLEKTLQVYLEVLQERSS